MSAVEILEPAAQARTGNSAALDVSGFSTLRLDLTARADFGLDPWCLFIIETSVGSVGPWREIYRRRFTHDHTSDAFWPRTGPERVVLSGFDSFVRCRWEARRQSETPDNAATGADIALFLGLAGDGQPDAA